VGNALEYKTGDWRSSKPVWDEEKCTKCRPLLVYSVLTQQIYQKDSGYYTQISIIVRAVHCAKECKPVAIMMWRKTMSIKKGIEVSIAVADASKTRTGLKL